MSRGDWMVIASVLSVSILLLFGLLLETKEGTKEAQVYYDGNLVKTIDLSSNETKEYMVEGYNGNVKIKVEQGKIKVVEENSPRHLCSKQGWSSENYESIVCLPNKIVIKIATKTELDTVVS